MYNHVVLGGTFDHFHAGHKDLLSLAFHTGKKITVGLTKPSMNQRKKFLSAIQPYKLREKGIIEFAKELHRETDIKIIPIRDIYGSTLIDETLEAIVVTPHTEHGAIQINAERKRRGLPALSVQICPLHHDDLGEVLCSTNIRAGICDRSGFRYDTLQKRDITLSSSAKEVLHRPFGKKITIAKLRDKRTPLFLIGDVVTDFCVGHNVSFTISYIDGKSMRRPYAPTSISENSASKTALVNPPGEIKKELSDHILKSFSEEKNKIFRIDGEEDLLTVASVLLLPLGSRVVYGYPFAPSCMRCITVTERIKQFFSKLVY